MKTATAQKAAGEQTPNVKRCATLKEARQSATIDRINDLVKRIEGKRVDAVMSIESTQALLNLLDIVYYSHATDLREINLGAMTYILSGLAKITMDSLMSIEEQTGEIAQLC
jgi:DNA integrity scanning protein DisA with diadenylate cyclase activity